MRKTASNIVCVAAFAVLAGVGLGIVYLTAPSTAAPDLARTRTTENRLFVVAIAPDDREPEIGRLSSWTIEIRHPDGRPVDGARLAIDGGMPDHDHGLPTRPQPGAELGDGRYRVNGVKFTMPGRWVLSFEISTADGRDRAVFNVQL